MTRAPSVREGSRPRTGTGSRIGYRQRPGSAATTIRLRWPCSRRANQGGGQKSQREHVLEGVHLLKMHGSEPRRRSRASALAGARSAGRPRVERECRCTLPVGQAEQIVPAGWVPALVGGGEHRVWPSPRNRSPGCSRGTVRSTSIGRIDSRAVGLGRAETESVILGVEPAVPRGRLPECPVGGARRAARDRELRTHRTGAAPGRVPTSVRCGHRSPQSPASSSSTARSPSLSTGWRARGQRRTREACAVVIVESNHGHVIRDRQSARRELGQHANRRVVVGAERIASASSRLTPRWSTARALPGHPN